MASVTRDFLTRKAFTYFREDYAMHLEEHGTPEWLDSMPVPTVEALESARASVAQYEAELNAVLMLSSRGYPMGKPVAEHFRRRFPWL